MHCRIWHHDHGGSFVQCASGHLTLQLIKDAETLAALVRRQSVHASLRGSLCCGVFESLQVYLIS
jgi:hypothetical protein